MKTPLYLQPISDREGQISSMRILMFIFTFFVGKLILSVCDYIDEFGKAGKVIDWWGMSAFISALTALIGLLILGKVQQSKIENRQGAGAGAAAEAEAVAFKNTEHETIIKHGLDLPLVKD